MARNQRSPRAASLWFAALGVLIGGAAMAQESGRPTIDVGAPAAMQMVTLATGDTLRCRVVQVTDTTVILEHEILGRMQVARASVKTIKPAGDVTHGGEGQPPPPSAEPDATQSKTGAHTVAEVDSPTAAGPTGASGSPLDVLTAPYEKSFWTGWTRSVDLGINGSAGNSDTFNGRIAFNLARKTTRMETTTGVLYLYQRDNEGVTKDRGEVNLRNDWLLTNSRWRVWAQGKGEYDADADWTTRVSGAAGLGYEFVQDERTTLIGRVGLGASREFGGEANDTVPEGVLGADFNHKVNDRNSLFANVDYFPDLSEFGEFRTVSKAGWETIVDPETKLNLKLGIEHRYDSDPGDAEASEVDYFVTLGWTF